MFVTTQGLIFSSIYDKDADAFSNATLITNTNTKYALHYLFSNLKKYNLWNLIVAFYPFVGGSATTHKFNGKDPRDLDAAYRLSFVGGWTHSSTGADPNGTNAYADTFIVPNSVLNSTSDLESFSYYSRENTTNSGEYVMGAVNPGVTGASCALIIRRSSGICHAYSDYASVTSYRSAQTTTSDGRGLFAASQNGTSLKLYKNGSTIASNTTVTLLSSRPSVSITLGAMNQNGPGPVDSWTNKECAFAHIGYKMSDTDMANLYTIVQNYQTILSRNV